jgi:hypothetical protein
MLVLNTLGVKMNHVVLSFVAGSQSRLWVVMYFAVLLMPHTTQCWVGMPTPPLHVDGNTLKDPANNEVLIHGWMQPTSSWFNGQGKWYRDPGDWTNPEDIESMLEYLKEVATVMTDTTPKYGRDHGWYASFVRMNTDAIGGWDAERGLYDTTQFNGWLNHFIIPYANYLKTRGLYFVLSATGPINTPNNGGRNAGVVEQQRLITFWSTVANYPGIKDADNIMFELMNEPVEIESAPGNGDWGMGQSKYFEAFTNWMQPVIDAVRATGANNVVWVPTLEWQGSPHQWAEFPFTGTNVGVAVHFYPAYGDVRDDATKLANLWERSYKPAADRWPMIITEMFWTPYPDDYWNLVNGSTNGFGNHVKQAIDTQGNVSYMVGFIGDLLDEFEARPMETSLIEDREGTPAYFSWLPDYAKQLRLSFGATNIPGRVEFEQFESMHGVQVESNPNNLAERHIGYVGNGSWARYKVNALEAGGYTIRFRVASGADSGNQIVVKSQSGSDVVDLATFTLNADSTNGWHDWYLDSVHVQLPAGEQELHLEFAGQSTFLFNLDWFEIVVRSDPVVLMENASHLSASLTVQHTHLGEPVLKVMAGAQEPSELRIYDGQGKLVLKKGLQGQFQMALTGQAALLPGVYQVVLVHKAKPITKTMIVF